MDTASRYLTKSRFKLAVECPTKLYYVGKPDYLDRSADDSFLASLAEGGYQIGELACLMYPEGVRVDDLNHQIALQKTAELLKQDNVTIFEAAIEFESLFIRVDILKKTGEHVEIIEVKAKSYKAKEDGDFRGARGQLKKEFLPYLRDVAFQRYVAANALPGCKVCAFLMLADKEQFASVDGLNQRFRVRRDDGRLRVDVAPGTDVNSLGTPLLVKVAVDGQADEILQGNLAVGPGQVLPFPDAVKQLAQSYADDRRIIPAPTTECGNCQFKADKWPTNGEPKSGFHECWASAFNWGPNDFASGTVLDLWNFPGKAKLIEQGVLKPSQVTLENLGFDGEAPGMAGMSRKHRQWYFCNPTWPGGGDYFFDKAGFREASKKWLFPLHCIDFETSTVAIPFAKGRRPYEIIAFQFSHHVIEDTGQVSHRSQWINADPGVDPNFDFVRALKSALGNDNGTIFRWAPHENMVLNHIRAQLLSLVEPPADCAELVAFIESITARAGNGKEKISGPRNMVDLCDLAEKFYFHPSTKGSNSLKKVLPALMGSSEFLRNHYGTPIYGGSGTSLNFKQPIAWWQEHEGIVVDPYSLLPPVFEDVPQQEVDAVEEGLSEELREGGAAMAAYARLQFEEMPAVQREATLSALLRYCELDTLAMVMAIQAWRDWAKEQPCV